MASSSSGSGSGGSCCFSLRLTIARQDQPSPYRRINSLPYAVLRGVSTHAAEGKGRRKGELSRGILLAVFRLINPKPKKKSDFPQTDNGWFVRQRDDRRHERSALEGSSSGCSYPPYARRISSQADPAGRRQSSSHRIIRHLSFLRLRKLFLLFFFMRVRPLSTKDPLMICYFKSSRHVCIGPMNSPRGLSQLTRRPGAQAGTTTAPHTAKDAAVVHLVNRSARKPSDHEQHTSTAEAAISAAVTLFLRRKCAARRGGQRPQPPTEDSLVTFPLHPPLPPLTHRAPFSSLRRLDVQMCPLSDNFHSLQRPVAHLVDVFITHSSLDYMYMCWRAGRLSGTGGPAPFRSMRELVEMPIGFQLTLQELDFTPASQSCCRVSLVYVVCRGQLLTLRQQSCRVIQAQRTMDFGSFVLLNYSTIQVYTARSTLHYFQFRLDARSIS